mgnify:CR=1 FL=1
MVERRRDLGNLTVEGAVGISIDPDTKVVFITTGTPWMVGGGDGNGGRH